MNETKNRFTTISAIWYATAIPAFLILADQFATGEQSGGYMLWLLAAGMTFLALRHSPERPDKTGTLLGWALLVPGLLLAYGRPWIGGTWCLWAIGSALWFRLGGARLGCKLQLPGFLFFVLVPNTGYLYLALSMPLSQICAALTTGILKLAGVACSANNAIIFVGDTRIAVTAACSGIELLEAMLLLGWIVVYFEQRGMLNQVLQYITLLPIILFTNTLRLVLVIALYLRIGEKAFEDPLHSIFGYAVVVATVLLLFGVGRLLPNPGKEKKS